MALSVRSAVSVCVFVMLFTGAQSSCPIQHARGREDKDRGRCILRCEDGYEPSGCHVVRNISGKWNYDIPVCQEKPIISGKALVGAGAVAVGTIVAAPAVLTAAGFTTAGVAAGSIAAKIQTPFTAAGSWFALSQSAGVLGNYSRNSYLLRLLFDL